MEKLQTNDKNIEDYLSEAEIKKASKLARVMKSIYFETPGKVKTEHLARVSKTAKAMFKGRENDWNFIMGVTAIFDKVVGLSLPADGSFLVSSKVLELCGYLEYVVAARSFIQRQRAIVDADDLLSVGLILSDWIKLDLLAFAWDDGDVKSPDIFGFFLATAHQAGRAGSLCINHYGPELLTPMYKFASSKGLNLGSQAPRSTPQAIVYRGGFSTTPQELASGMCWSEDLGQAKWYAKRRLGQSGDAFVVSTVANPMFSLARFEHEAEVVLPYDPARTFQVISNVQTQSPDTQFELENV